MGKKELIDKIMNATVAAAAKEIGAKMDNKKILEAANALIQQEDEAEMLWAAKGKPVGFNGTANGIAVSEAGNRAIIVKCHSYIDKKISKGEIDICGVPVLKKPNGAEIRSPLDSLEEKLKGPIMAIPVFRDFELHKRYVNIDIGECHFTEAWSLSLTIIMSLINAINKRKEDPYTVYSANVISSGELEPVEKIVRKLQAAKNNGIKRFILSSKNKSDIPKELLNMPDFEILFFDDIYQVMDFLKISQPDSKSSSKKSSGITKTKKVTKQKDNISKNLINGDNAMYKPKPIDTEHIKIPKNLEKLIELLSENSHDIWARQRMDEGWTFGPERNDPEKKHPDLIPYDELLPSEQEYDRITVMGALKAIMALGYRIEKK